MEIRKWIISDQDLDAQIKKAKAIAKEANDTEPRAKSVSYDSSSGLIIISLKNGAFFSFPPRLVQGLENASNEDLNDAWLDASGSSVHWDSLDVDFDVAGLIAGIFGTKAWMSELGRNGGKVTSSVKAEASRSNGKKGGRPRKSPLQQAIEISTMPI
jgi:hypothetical protein